MRPTFEWDERKAALNYRKHRVSFGEASTAFSDALARIYDDPDHSVDERREIIVGLSNRQRLLLVAFTERGENVIRIISARLANAKERLQHEEII